MSKDEIDIIQDQAEWIDETNEYKVPPFMLKEKKIKFPKLPYGQGIHSFKKNNLKKLIISFFLSNGFG